MDVFKIVSILIILSAMLGYLNLRYVKLPHIIGLLVLSMITSILFWIGSTVFQMELAVNMLNVINKIDFSKVLLNVMLCFMLFAGSFHTNATAIKKEIKSISILAFGGTIISTFLVGGLLFLTSQFLSFNIPFIYCILFGALISPTDPIAVLGIISKSKIQERIKTNIIGESLFNDGIGIVIFITVLEIIDHGTDSFSMSQTILLFLQEAVGGIALGALMGYLAFLFLKSIDSYEVEIMITLALVTGGTFIADYLHISGPLAMVVAGLIIGGDNLRKNVMSDSTVVYMDKFWELVDMGLNSVLFVLIGLRLALLSFSWNLLIFGLISIFIVLLARFISIKTLAFLFKKQIVATGKEQLLLVWCGLRGGLSLAMALSVSAMDVKEPIVFITYATVLFSIIIQGLTVEKLANNGSTI
ncbi:MAG: sodium:proton antiporter [Bacteroidetes bacterium]|nr:sodium:proton antiporter [Bacteroidota bacterium]